jgi:hypothetical protein
MNSSCKDAADAGAEFAPRRLLRAGKLKTCPTWLLAAVVGVTLLSSGCVERRMMIRSDPPGARVYVDDYDVGVTPTSASFTYYGRRKIRLVKDGYETLTVLQPVWPPWYEVPPLDFFSENLVPGQLRDQRVFTYQLRPQVLVQTDQLLARAEQLRRGAQPAVPGQAMPPAPGMRINPPPRGPATVPIPGEQPALAPPPVGGQPTYPLPEGR